MERAPGKNVLCSSRLSGDRPRAVADASFPRLWAVTTQSPLPPLRAGVQISENEAPGEGNANKIIGVRGASSMCLRSLVADFCSEQLRLCLPAQPLSAWVQASRRRGGAAQTDSRALTSWLAGGPGQQWPGRPSPSYQMGRLSSLKWAWRGEGLPHSILPARVPKARRQGREGAGGSPASETHTLHVQGKGMLSAPSQAPLLPSPICRPQNIRQKLQLGVSSHLVRAA